MVHLLDKSASSKLDDAVLWRAVRARDKRFDGRFVYSVATTGVYCRPSCPSRIANRENVRFHLTSRDAESAGFRPCKRCSPDKTSSDAQIIAKIVEACRLIEGAEEAPKLDEIARSAGFSPFHFQRLFKRIVGVSPKHYEIAHRQKRAHDLLERSLSVTEAIYDAGFNSNARFYATAQKSFGMTPSQSRTGGAGAELRFAIAECSLGAVLIAMSDKGVCAISLGGDPEELLRDFQKRFRHANIVGGDSDFENIIAQVIGFIEQPEIGFDLPLDIRGTAFQQRVWKALCAIPLGSTASYSEIAGRIGAPKSARAVAQACAANPIAVAVPCHRIVRNNGALSGYRWGVERKRTLLDREARALSVKP